MQKIAIIGAGISGLTVGRLLKGSADVTLFEREATAGGLVRCRRVEDSLFHTCGGHVFNSKRQEVIKWFWEQFDKEEEFVNADRNSVIYLDGKDGTHNVIPYPIENHAYLLSPDTQKEFIRDLITLSGKRLAGEIHPSNFEEFLKKQFGDTLYRIYFQPYNKKVWRRELKNVPLTWLEGKLPMPTLEEMIYNNFNHIKEQTFVHSSFWYEKIGGSQFLADRLSEGLNIQYNNDIKKIRKCFGKWEINGTLFDKVVFCGNIKDMADMIVGADIDSYKDAIASLEYHGTTAVFCELDANPYSWIYLPSHRYGSHRIICTGNFSKSNNSASLKKGRITGTVEFTDAISKDEILANLRNTPLHPAYLTHQYNRYSYPIQDANTRNMIRALKSKLAPHGFFFTGRFADWEYYNMDIAMEAAMALVKSSLMIH